MSRARDVASNNLAVDTTPTLQGDLTMGSNSIADGVMPVKNTGSAPSELRLYCETGNAHYVALKSPAHSAFSGNHTITMPPNTGTSGQFLSTDGNGVTSWAAAGGGAWDLISTTVATGSGSLMTFADQFSTTYDNYQAVGTCMRPASGGIGYLYMRLLSGSGSTTVHSNDYAYVNNYSNTQSGGTGYRQHTSNSFTFLPLANEGQTSDQYYTQSFILDFFDPYRNLGVMHLNMQSQGMVTRSSSMNVAFGDTRARWNGGASVNLTGFDVFYSGGANIEGRVSVFGQKKS